MFQRLARTCYRRRWSVVAAWVVLLIGLSVVNSAAAGTFRDEFAIPGSESQDAFDLLEDRGFESVSGFQGQIVVRADGPDGVRSPEVRQYVEGLFDEIESSVPDTSIASPFTDEGARQVSDDGTIAYGEIDMADRDSNEFDSAGKTVRDIVTSDAAVAERPAGVEVELGGDIFVDPAEFSSEGVGLVAAAIILLLAFGSVLAMGLPIMTALFGIGCGIALVGLTVNLITMPTFSNQTLAMIGIGVGIDYALFIVTRYREGLHDGLSPEGAVVRAIDTAGRAVLFAGSTVVIAIMGLFTIGLAFVRGLAVGISLGVLLTMLASLTLLPAVLGFVGTNIDRLGLPGRRRRAARVTSATADRTSLAYRWSQVVQRRPWPIFVIDTVLLLALTLPLFGIRLGFADASNRPEEDTTRRAFDLLSEGFGPGANGPLLLAADLPGGSSDMPVLEGLVADLDATPGVASVSPPIPNEDSSAAIVSVVPDSAPQDEETQQLVRDLRDDVVPAATQGSDVDVMVTGRQGATLDYADFTADRLPWFMGAVLVLSFLLLMVVFRSVLVPAKAVVMNLLSVGAAYGVIVAVFQWGWGKDLFGIGEPGPIEAWVPMMMFAIIFGLSMDYEVFLLSRIREDYDRTGDNASAVASGVAVTARVITAAAAIMFFVFGSFVLGIDRGLALFGFGLAVAVLLDATVVRLVLVPATMELLGARNWWMPAWLDRIVPVVHVEPVEPAAGSEPAVGGVSAAPGAPVAERDERVLADRA
jgi:putative drug exporter of the RND superfamily